MSARWLRIGEVLTRRSDSVVVDADAKYAMVGLLNRGRGLFDRGTIRGVDTKYPRLQPLSEGDLVYSRLFGWEGAVALADRDGWVSPEFPAYAIDESVVFPGFIAHVIRLEAFVRQLADGTTGLGQRRQRVPPSTFEAARIVVPDLSEQRRVAARLDTLASAADHARSCGASRIDGPDLSTQLIETLFAESGLPFVPARDLYTAVSDVVFPGEDPAPAARFVGLEHIESHTGRRIGTAPIGEMKGRKLRFAEGDVLYGYLRPYLNKVWVADGPGLTSVEQYALRPNHGVDPHLLAHALRSGSTLEQVKAATHTLQLPRIRAGLLGSIPVPDVREAPAGLRERLDGVLTQAVRMRDLVAVQNRALDSLLPAARNEEFSRLVAQADGLR